MNPASIMKMMKAADEAEKVYDKLCEAESELNEENVDKLRLQYEKVADSWTCLLYTSIMT